MSTLITPEPGPVLTASEFRDLAARGQAPTDVIVRKQTTLAEVKASGNERTLEIRITTGSRDRDHDTLNPAGWHTDAYLRNPVVMYAHDYYGLPIARTTSIKKDARGLVATAEFTSADLNPLGDTVYRMMRAKFLNAASVGFRPLKHAWNSEEGGVDYQEQELLEWSVVPVPANAECLVGAKAAGIDVAPLVRAGVFAADPHEVVAVLTEDAPVADVDRAELGRLVDEALALRLARAGIGAAADLVDVDPAMLRSVLGEAVDGAMTRALLKHTGRLD